MLPTTQLDHDFGSASDEAGLGCLATTAGNLPLSAVDVFGHVTGLLYTTQVRQTFRNSHDEALEATYIFPLPDRAAVTKFRMEVGDRVIEGVLGERAQARLDYDEAIQAGKRAAIAEEERPGVFTVRVGNLQPGEEATVELVLTGPLALDSGEATWRFPLVVAPRYIPGTPRGGKRAGDGTAEDTDAVPDASRISPPVLLRGFPNPVRLNLAVYLDPAGLTVSDIRTSLPADIERTMVGPADVAAATLKPVNAEPVNAEPVNAEPAGAGSAGAGSAGAGSASAGSASAGSKAVSSTGVGADGAFGTWVTARPDQRLDRDFVVRFTVGAEALDAALVADDGAFALTIVPPARATSTRVPRDVVFVLDRSGSMGGWKMTAARRAVARMVDTLDAGDRFAVVAFDDRIEYPDTLGAGLHAATDRNRFRAVEYLAALDARGGTEMLAPLSEAASLLHEADRGAGAPECVLVLATDGQVGNEDQILAALAPQTTDLRIFTVGIDTAVNDAFLRRLAALGGGSCEVVESEDRLDEVMARIHRRIGTPLLTGLSVEGVGFTIEPNLLAPERLPALFEGAPLLVLGRYQGEATGAVRIHAVDAAGKPWSTEVAVGSFRGAAGGTLAAAWARARIRDLEDRYVTSYGDDTIEQEIVRTSLQGQVLSRFTAFVAVDVQVVNEGGTLRRVTQPVDLPAGWESPDSDLERRFSGGMAAPMSAQLDARPGAAYGASVGGQPKRAKDMASAFPASMAAPAAMPAPAPPSPSMPAPTLAKLSRARQKEPRQPDQPVTFDLAHYRNRADRMIQAVDSGTLDINGLRRSLIELIEDLRSVGVPEADLVGITALATALEDGTWTGNLTALRDFASDRPKPFWKR